MRLVMVVSVYRRTVSKKGFASIRLSSGFFRSDRSALSRPAFSPCSCSYRGGDAEAD